MNSSIEATQPSLSSRGGPGALVEDDGKAPEWDSEKYLTKKVNFKFKWEEEEEDSEASKRRDDEEKETPQASTSEDPQVRSR